MMRLALRLFVCSLLFALALRTWVVLGIFAPLRIEGSSMAPTLRGDRLRAVCRECQSQVEVGTDFLPVDKPLPCPACGVALSLESSRLALGDRLFVDRTAYQFRRPRRGELVVALRPDDGTRYCVKRLVGLPGESVELQGGEVFLDGRIWKKPVELLRKLRHPVHRETEGDHRWQSEPAEAWQWSVYSWHRAAADAGQTEWLAYHHPAEQAITDDLESNVGITRPLHTVDDLSLSALYSLRGEGELFFRLGEGAERIELSLSPASATVRLSRGNIEQVSHALSPASRRQLAKSFTQLELVWGDEQILLVIEDKVELRWPWTKNDPEAGNPPRLAIGAAGLSVEIANLTLSRDVFYTNQAVGLFVGNQAPLQLGEDEYFLLGDNPPISRDSRNWGPVPARLILGRAIPAR